MIQSGQLASLIKEHIISPVTYTSNANSLKTALIRVEALGYVEASVELRQMWKEAQAREAILKLIETDGVYRRIIKYMVRGMPTPNIVALTYPDTSKDSIRYKVSKIDEAIMYFRYEPRSVTLSRIMGANYQ